MTRGALLAAAFLLASCSADQAPLVASDVRVTAPMPGAQMSAGYLTLTNNSAADITITHVTSPQFGNIEMHESVIEDGVARMIRLNDVTVPGKSSVDFTRGGKHLMLMQPREQLETVSLDFHADDAVVLSVSVNTGA